MRVIPDKPSMEQERFIHSYAYPMLLPKACRAGFDRRRSRHRQGVRLGRDPIYTFFELP